MRKFKVYLAGPIAGLTYDGAQDWREMVRDALEPDIEGYSPLRNKEYLRSHGVISANGYTSPMACDRGIMTRDHYDCQTSDMIFANLLGAKSVSVGTVMEIAWAYAYRKPIVVAMETESNLHDHPMIREAIGYRVTNLPEAVAITRGILLSNS